MPNAHNSPRLQAVVSREGWLVTGIKMKGRPGCPGSQGQISKSENPVRGTGGLAGDSSKRLASFPPFGSEPR